MAHVCYLTQPCNKMSIDYCLRFASAVHSEEFIVNPTDSSVFYLSTSSVLGPRLLLDDAVAAEAGRCGV